MTATKPEDKMITAYRDHGLAIAKGVSAKACMAEMFGKATGCSKGKGGSMHFFGKDVNFYGGHGIVGAQIGTGAGLRTRLVRKSRASGTVIDENPYPSAPFTIAEPSVMAARASS